MGMEVYFPPYQVGSFAMGGHTVTVLYADLAPLIRMEFVTALGIEREFYDWRRRLSAGEESA